MRIMIYAYIHLHSFPFLVDRTNIAAKDASLEVQTLGAGGMSLDFSPGNVMKAWKFRWFLWFLSVDMGTLKLVQLLKLTKAVWGKDKPWVWRHRTSFPLLRWHKLEVKCPQVLHCSDWLQAFFTDLQLWLKSEINGWRLIFAACTCTKKLCHLGVWLQVAFDVSHPSCFEPGFPFRDKFLITLCFS